MAHYELHGGAADACLLMVPFYMRSKFYYAGISSAFFSAARTVLSVIALVASILTKSPVGFSAAWFPVLLPDSDLGWTALDRLARGGGDQGL